MRILILIVTVGFAALYGLFAERPGPAVLSPELNAQLVSALYDYKPSINDTGEPINTSFSVFRILIRIRILGSVTGLPKKFICYLIFDGGTSRRGNTNTLNNRRD